MRHLRTAAIIAACAALVLGLPLAVALAQSPAPDVAAAAPAADPLITLLGSLGPTGGAGAIVAYVLHSWRTEAARHAAERDDLRARLGALELGAALAAERHRALIETLGSIRAALERA